MRLPKPFTAVSIAGVMVATAFVGALPAAANGCGFSTRDPSGGTEAVPFQVIDEADLRCLAANPEYWDDYFVQTSNISMVTVPWTPIGTSSNPFAGGFDGGDFAIRGLAIPAGVSHAAMFAYASRATFANINLESVDISGTSHVAGLVGLVNDGTGTVSPTLRATTITNVSVSGILKSTGVVGGLVAEMTSNLTDADENYVTTIVRSSGLARIETSSRVAGGIVGKASGIVVANSTSTGLIADQSVMPTSVDPVDLCDPNQFLNLDTNSDGFFDRTEDPSTQGIGGIVGYGERVGINDSTSETIITSASNRLGGIAGNLLSSDMENSTATGFVNSRTAECVGGLVGIMENTTVSDSHWGSQGPVIGLAIVGGLAGLAGWGAQVYDSGASGDQVTAVPGVGSGPVGGAIGMIYAPYQQYPTHITGSWSTVPVQGAFAAGGLVGYVFSGSSFGEVVPEHAVFQSWSSSSVRLSGSTDTTPMAGGLVGFLFGGRIGSSAPISGDPPVAPGVYPSVVSQSYAVGNVAGDGIVGGLVGYMAGMIWDSYATGEIEGASTGSAAAGAGAGGLVGSTIEAVFTSISRTYALGPVSVGNDGDPAIGGLVGSWGTDPNASTIAPNSFSLTGALRPLGVNTQSARNDQVENGSLAVSRTSSQLREIATYASWAYQQFPNGPTNSITSQWLAVPGTYIWGICNYANNGYPFLQWQYTSDPCVAPDNGGGGGEQTTPVITPVAAPAVIVESVVLKPVALNPVIPEMLSPGVVLVSEAVAALTPERVMRNPPASALGDAPRVQAIIGAPLALVTSGLPANSTQSVRLKINGKYVDLGITTTDADGQAVLPVFRISRAGTYTIAMINSVTGKTSYVKVVVPKRQRR